MSRQITPVMNRLGVAISAAVSVLAALVVLHVPQKSALANGICWKLGTSACSLCGVGSSCINQACVKGYYSWNCPEGSNEWTRLTPESTTVPACKEATTGSRKHACSANISTTWCVGSTPCNIAGSACSPDPARGGGRFCKAPMAGATTSNVCGIHVDALAGTSCP